MHLLHSDYRIIQSNLLFFAGTTTDVDNVQVLDRVAYMDSIQCAPGPQRMVNRSKVYQDVLSMFTDETIAKEYPLFIKFCGEMAVDEGGVQRDMLSAFWERAYQLHFDGAKTLIPP